MSEGIKSAPSKFCSECGASLAQQAGSHECEDQVEDEVADENTKYVMVKGNVKIRASGADQMGRREADSQASEKPKAIHYVLVFVGAIFLGAFWKLVWWLFLL